MDTKFGDKVKDTVTGFTGIVTAHAHYSTGCNQVLVQPKLDKKSAWSEPRWFDIERIEIVKVGACEIATSPTGGPRGSEAAPIR